MSDTKHWYQSKAVWGAMVTIVASLAQLAGLEIDGEAQDQIGEALMAISGGIGGLVAIYGRIRAETRIGG
jgi:hypothetical protein